MLILVQIEYLVVHTNVHQYIVWCIVIVIAFLEYFGHTVYIAKTNNAKKSKTLSCFQHAFYCVRNIKESITPTRYCFLYRQP